jgi:Cof subfamily protein (haloacid dehalogenase superfamily)
MDGTFLPHEKMPLQIDIDAVNRFKSYGGKFAFATGRVPQAAEKFLQTGITNFPSILGNGSTIYDHDKGSILWNTNLSPECIPAVREIAREFPQVSVEVNTPDKILVCRENARELWHINYVGFKNWESCTLTEAERYPWSKVLFAGENDDIRKLSEYVSKRGFDCGEFVQSSDIFYEILPKGCTKGSALTKLREILGQDSFVIGMGDFYNDYELLQNSDFSACPSNAEPDVKNICDYVCKSSVEEGAAAEVLGLLFDNKINLYKN